MTEARMNARYAGNCRICGQRFPAGTDIFYEKGRGARHAGCEEVVLPTDAIAISRESDPYHQGEVVKARVSGQWKYVTVLACSQRYFPEDGMSFGLSDDSGYLYSAKCREATEEESRPLREREAFRQELVNKRYALRQIADRIINENSLPHLNGDDWWHIPDSQEVQWGDRNNGYGGGSWFAITPEWIMFVRNNGNDGDNWSYNNYVTGSAGAIAWGIPFDEALATEIRELAGFVDKPVQDIHDLAQMSAWLKDPVVDDR